MTKAHLAAIRVQTVICMRTLGPILLLVFGGPLLEGSSVFSQATTAITHTSGVGDLGTRTISQGQTTQITGGTRTDQGSGTNLFHSFDQFSVGDGHTAKFLNTTPSLHTDNILSRVTGGDSSGIFGTIDTTSYPGANFFLMNPGGIVFGPNATLQVGGSVAFTTADYLRLAGADASNAGIFHADLSATPQLSSAPVAAFGFLGDNPAAIKVNETTLPLDPGQTFSLVGGNITIQSSMLADAADTAAGNQVFIASVASPGDILVGTLASAPNINSELPKTLGTIDISQGSTIDTSNRDGGSIHIRGGQLIVDGSNIFAGSGGILLNGTSISIKNSATFGTYTITTANAGNVVLQASRDIVVDSNSRVESQTFSASRDAGNITLRSQQGKHYSLQ
ncbi:MAG: filamentous hemagglutinin N-terminal domain-containing protein [Nitrospira sp.]|nr:filamentous hemagglutinin N-terminal domain-containing protein [Nitrospira sp.]